MTKSILSILDEVSFTSSSLAKIHILGKHKDNKELQAVFVNAYNPFINFWIKEITQPKKYDGTNDLSHALKQLQKLIGREYTGNAAREFITNVILKGLTKEDAEVISRIIDRDLRIGCSESTANKVWPGLIPTFDVMLSHKDISGIKFPCYGQIKSDGARCHMSLINGKAVALSRSGKAIKTHGVFDSDLALLISEGETLDGELLCYEGGAVMDRQTGNGIINKAIKNTITPEEAILMHFATWDIVDFSSSIPYDKRIERLTISENTARDSYKPTTYEGKIYVLPTEIIENKIAAQEFFEVCRSAGEEGAMLKNMDMVWEPKRSKNIGKMKAEESADLVIVGREEGAGKNVGKLGAFICETSDGKLRVNVGTGFSDEDRKLFWAYSMIYQIIEVKYNQIIQDKNGGLASLFLPRFMGVRYDKNVANSLKELK